MRLRSLQVAALLCSTLWSCQSSKNQDAPPTETGADGAIEEVSSADGQEPAAPIDVSEETDRLMRLQQKQAFLAEQYIQQGDALLERADLQGALEQYAQALEVSPSSQEARERMRKVESLMGDTYAQASELMDDAVARESVRRAQARMAAEQATLEGDNALRSGDYATAIQRYRSAQTVLRYHPLIADNTLDEKIVTNKLESATRMQAEQAAAQQRSAAEAARAAKDKAESENARYRENQLVTLYTDANRAWQLENYDTAEQLTNQVLVLDPGNPHALKLRDLSQAARHRKRDEQIQRALYEEWLKTMDDLNTMGVPQGEPVVFDDLDHWRDVEETRVTRAFSIEDTALQSERAQVLARLDAVRIRARFGSEGAGAPLTEIAAFLQQVTGINFLVSNKVTEELDEEQTSIFLDLPERSVRKVLDIISETHSQLFWKVEDGLVRFVTAEEMRGGQVLRMYGVNDLIHPVRDFPGREINVIPSNGIEYADEDVEEREALVVTPDSLDALIRENVEPESWEADPANTMRISGGTLVVNQTPEVQEKIEKLLNDLREATGIMVDIEARFLKVEDSFLEDIGVDFRGLGSPGLGSNGNFNDFGDPSAQADLGAEIGQDTSLGAFYDDGNDGEIGARIEQLYDTQLGGPDTLTGSGGLSFQWTFLNDLELELILRAVSKSQRVQLVTTPKVLVFNTARASLSVLNQVAYVQDYDVQIAQGASIADPIINVVQDGVVLDVRPVVWADRRFITLEVRPTVATLRRPIVQRSTALGSPNPVTIQLPELEISRVRTTLPIPDGGTVLLGGFKIHEEQDQRSGVPFLNKIPVLSMLFERKGNFVSNRKLLILLKARIVIPSEHEPTPAQLGIQPER
jgi:Flp pilus assembly secretin CpaC/tetratricopeptide (TPR) repeat protein